MKDVSHIINKSIRVLDNETGEKTENGFNYTQLYIMEFSSLIGLVKHKKHDYSMIKYWHLVLTRI